MRFDANWQVNLALQRTLRNDATVTLTLHDAFDSFQWRWTSGAPGDPLYIDTTVDFFPRYFSLTYSTRFGSGRTAQERFTASDEVRGRVQ